MGVDVKIKWTKKKTLNPSLKAKNYAGLFDEIKKKKTKGNPIGEFDWEDFTFKAFGDKSGTIKKVELSAGWTMTIPKWPAKGKAKAAEKAAWEKAIAALAKHEETHRLYHLEAIAKFATALGKLESPTMADIEAEFEKLKTDHKKEQSAYDSRTKHGVSEGATLPHPGTL